MTEYVVADFPTIMDGYVVRWATDLAAANDHRWFLSASRERVAPAPGIDVAAVPSDVVAQARVVHELIRDWYAAGGHGPKTWAHVLTHRRPFFGPLEPLTTPVGRTRPVPLPDGTERVTGL